MKRPKLAKPDPSISIIGSKLPGILAVTANGDGGAIFHNWLPDITPAKDVDEADIEDDDNVNSKDPIKSCPDPLTNVQAQPQDRKAKSAEIARWAFDTYCTLVKKRIQIYNKYRAQVNTASSPSVLPQYRQACRLANEQILRRDLPTVKQLTTTPFSWKYEYPILPVFSITITFTIDGDEIVKAVKITATVEARQHVIAGMMSPFTKLQAIRAGDAQQNSWSSLLTSSSSSEFDPVG